MTKALFLDIDGTLVSFKTHEIPLSAIEALTTAKAKGMRIFIATGRPRIVINNLSALQERNLIDGYITMNGAYCFAEDSVIYKSPIPTAEVDVLTAFCHNRNIPCILVEENDIYVNQPNGIVEEIFHGQLKIAPIGARPYSGNHSGQEIYQLTPFINTDEERILLPALPNCEMGRWHPAFVDATAKGNTKQNGIDLIIRHFNIQREETMAFGDGGNDIGMLRHAGVGIAMGNAQEDVKAAADYVTSGVDDNGIANALKWFKII
ncbi:Cof-type HAD-IIB family hydrolase [Bacteroides zoogleoformans]|uniref:Cof-type HAD-IIB family hydrolase n=1 Tax=Bacteroides zoogleoformans TaxID=28119 RepID=UPI00248D59C1|nr:Cof-type HAD-IIB family hydrolase [Bacteroides zoogleoformans]